MQTGAVPSAGLLLMKPGPLPGRSLTTQQEMPSRGVSQTLQGESLTFNTCLRLTNHILPYTF